jgi:hypothetical protein
MTAIAAVVAAVSAGAKPPGVIASEPRERAGGAERGVWGPASDAAGGSAGAKPPGFSQDPQKPAPAAVAGRWAAALDIESMGIANVTLVFTQEGAKLGGTYTGRYGTFPLEGSIEGRKLSFTVYLKTDAGDSAMYFTGEVAEDGRTMKGGLTIEGMGDATWSAKRQPDE